MLQEKDRKRKQRLEAAAAVTVVAALYIFMGLSGAGCPIKFVTGISCAGCGMTRAWLSVLRLDWKSAFYYHPLFWTIPIAALVYMLRSRFSKKRLNILLFIFALLFGIVYLYRMFYTDSGIVVFKPQDNMFFRVIKFFDTEVL